MTQNEVKLIVDRQNDVIRIKVNGEEPVSPYTFNEVTKQQVLQEARAQAFIQACQFPDCYVSENWF